MESSSGGSGSGEGSNTQHIFNPKPLQPRIWTCPAHLHPAECETGGGRQSLDRGHEVGRNIYDVMTLVGNMCHTYLCSTFIILLSERKNSENFHSQFCITLRILKRHRI